MERPVGVTILAILVVLFGVLGLFGALGLLALGGLATARGAATGVGFPAAIGGIMAMILAVALLLLSVLNLIFGIGAWMLKPWAWTFGVALQFLSILLSFGQMMSGHFLGGLTLGIVIAGAILYYLFRPTVKEAFGMA